jgi:Tol biopolymer transport system component
VRRLVVLLPVLLAVVGCGTSAAPRTELLFVSTRDGDYAIYGAGGGHEHRLTKGRGNPSSLEGLFSAIEPAWSLDGRLIAFASRRDGRSHIYVMRADGTSVRRLTDAASDDHSPTWSPDRSQIAFARGEELFVVASAGGPAHRISRGAGGEAGDPAWSPDGKLIAYDYRPSGLTIREIWVIGAGGGRPRPVTKLRALSMLPSWSPGGRDIAFQSNVRERHFEIYSIALDGSGLRRETRSPIDTIDPAWSPNGREIAFSRDGAIWAVDRTGHERKVTSGGNDSAPVWRPAGAAK